MTIHHPIRRFFARICSRDTMAQVVDPILADVRWERGSSWLACVVLIRALVLHAVVSLPETVNRAWHEDGFAMPRIALLSAAASLVFAVPVVAPTLRFPEAGAWVLLMPQALAWTLPPVLLFAIPFALRGQAVSTRVTRRTIVLALGLVAVTFALVLWVAPVAYESYRQIEAVFIKPGDTNIVVDEFPRWSAAPAARLLDYQFHQRLVFGSAALPFALLGLGLSTMTVVRRRPWLYGTLAAGAWMFAAFPLELWTSALLLRASSVPPFVLAWTPNVLIFVIGTAMLTRQPALRRPQPAE
jgi:hypothetical protein